LHSKSYSQHLRDSKGCSHRWRILTLKPDVDKRTSETLPNFRIVPVRCNSKACPHCSRRYFSKIRHRFNSKLVTNQFRFFTLTTRHAGEPNQEELEHLENSFRELRKHLKRKYKDFLYFSVRELSPSGMWHIHGIWNIYIDVKELSRMWEKYSNAYRVDVRKIRSAKGAVNYLFKYIFKSAYNDDEKRIIYESDKRKFSYSRAFFNKNKSFNPYTSDLGTDYSVPELKEKLFDLVRNTSHSFDDFDGAEYPYFDSLLEAIFYEVYNKGEPSLFYPEPPEKIIS